MGPISYTQFKVIANNTEIHGDDQVELVAGKKSSGLACCRPNGEKRVFSTPEAQADASQFVRSQLMDAVRKQLGKVPDNTALLDSIEEKLLGPDAKTDKTKTISIPLDKRTIAEVVKSVEDAKAKARNKATVDNGGSKNVETKPQGGEPKTMSMMEQLEAEFEAKEKKQAELAKSNEANKAENAPAIEEFKAVVNPKPLTLKDLAQAALGTVAGAPNDKLCMGVANGFAVRFLAPGSEPQGEGKVTKRLYQVDKDAINAATKNLKDALLGLAAGIDKGKQEQVKALLTTEPDRRGIECLTRQAVADAIRIIAGELKGTEGELDLDELQAAQDTGDVSLDAVLLSKDENCHKVHAWFDARHQADVAFMESMKGKSADRIGTEKRTYLINVHKEVLANPPDEQTIKLLDKEFAMIQGTSSQLDQVKTQACTKNPFVMLEPEDNEHYSSSRAIDEANKRTGGGPVCADIAADTTNNGGYIAWGIRSGQEECTFCDQSSELVAYETAKQLIQLNPSKQVLEYTGDDEGKRKMWAAAGVVVNSEKQTTDMVADDNQEFMQNKLLFTSMPSFNTGGNRDVKGGASWMCFNLVRINGGSDNLTKKQRENSEAFFEKVFEVAGDLKEHGVQDTKALWGFEDASVNKGGEMLMIAQFLGDPSVFDPLADNVDKQVGKLLNLIKKGNYKKLLDKAVTNYKATLEDKMSSWIKLIVASGAKAFIGSPMGCGFFCNPPRVVAKIFAKLYIKMGGDIPMFFPAFTKGSPLANTWKAAFEEAWEEHLDAQVHKISSQDMALLKEIASVARGSGEGSGGAGYMGIVNGRAVKFLTKWTERLSGLDNLSDAEKSAVNESTANLRSTLESLAKKISVNLSRRVAQILQPKGQAKNGLEPPITREAVALAMTEIMKYADDGYGKLDWKKVEKAKSLERSGVLDVFVSAGLKTDYKLNELGAKTPIKNPENGTRLKRREFSEKVKKNCKGKIPVQTFVYAINQFSVQAYKLKVGSDALKNRYLEVLGKLKEEIAEYTSPKHRYNASSIETVLKNRIAEFKNAREEDLRELLEEMEMVFDEVRNLYANPAVSGTRENEVL